MKRRTNFCIRLSAAPSPPQPCARPKPRPWAFIVGQAVGLEMGTASSDYIQLYHGNASLLAESLEVVQRTASTILRALEVDDMAGMSMADAEVA